jgi:phosphopantothenoylcysteine decarboxylase/phosphopantothenate--cysteine ligase
MFDPEKIQKNSAPGITLKPQDPEWNFKKVIITSGPTIEPIDPIRFISNRASGKSGYHLANEAKKRGIPEIIYITGPSFYIPDGVSVIKIETARQMRFQLKKHAEQADVIIMAAAVGDYRVIEYQKEKIKKSKDNLTLQLTRNPDLLWELGKKKGDRQILVGYAAETGDIFENAKNKLEAKNLDLLILNKISADNPAFQVDRNQVYFVTQDIIRGLPKMEKAEIAFHIWDEIYKIAKG